MPPNIVKGNFETPLGVKTLERVVSKHLGFNILRANEFKYEGEAWGENGVLRKIFVVNIGTYSMIDESQYLLLENNLIQRLEKRMTGAPIFVETGIIKQIRTTQLLKNFLQKFDVSKLVSFFYDTTTKRIRYGDLLKELKMHKVNISIQDLVDLIPYTFPTEYDCSLFFNGVIHDEVYLPITLEYTPQQKSEEVKILIEKAHQTQSIGLNPESIIISDELDHDKVSVIVPVLKSRLIAMIGRLNVNFFAVQKDGDYIEIAGERYPDTIFASIISSLYILHSNRFANGNLYNSLAVHVTKPGSLLPLDTLVQFGDTSSQEKDSTSTEAHAGFMSNLFKDLEDLIRIIESLKSNPHILVLERENAQKMLNNYLRMLEKNYGTQVKFIIKSRLEAIFLQ